MQDFSSIDLVRGFYQLALENSSKELTAFSEARGHYQFKRMPVGLRNAPSAFKREMQFTFKGFSRNNLVIYIGDVLLMSQSFEEHVVMVEKVLKSAGHPWNQGSTRKVFLV